MVVVYGAIDNPNVDGGGNPIDDDGDSSSGSGGCFLKVLLGQ
jgi:hypothetical protein